MDLLQDVARAVIDACPADHKHAAKLKAELGEDWSRIDLRCANERGEEVMSELPGAAGVGIHLLLDQIREDMARQAGERWTTCVFTLRPDRSFKLDVSYSDSIDENPPPATPT